MPGRSVMMTSFSPLRRPSFFSTVTPGQLPTNWLAPVSALNSVVLPQFGLPASAILISMTIPPRLDFSNLYPEIKRAIARRLTIPPGFT